MNGDYSERLSQESECREAEQYGILERASAIALGVLKEIEALAGTTACKSVQLVRLKKWALEQGCWFSDRTQFGEFFDRGSENETYLSPDQNIIIKLNDFRYSDDNLTSFFERLNAHNKYFPDCAYRMIGFGENSDGKVCAVLVQRFVHSVRLATKQEDTRSLRGIAVHRYGSDTLHPVYHPRRVLHAKSPQMKTQPFHMR